MGAVHTANGVHPFSASQRARWPSSLSMSGSHAPATTAADQTQCITSSSDSSAFRRGRSGRAAAAASNVVDLAAEEAGLAEPDADLYELPLIVSLTLLKHHLNRYPVPDWVHQQVYLHPYPKELMLRNHV